MRRTALTLVLFLGPVGCDEGRHNDLKRQRDDLVSQRQSLILQQAMLQLDIRQNLLNGRPPGSLTRDEQARINASPQGKQLALTTDTLKAVDARLESVQHDLNGVDNTPTPFSLGTE